MPTIPFQIPGYFDNENGVYINPADELSLESGGQCCMQLKVPCGYVKTFDEIKIENQDGACVFSWCKVQNALQSLAANKLLESNEAGLIDPALTSAQISCAQANAKLSNCTLV